MSYSSVSTLCCFSEFGVGPNVLTKHSLSLNQANILASDTKSQLLGEMNLEKNQNIYYEEKN